MKRFITLILLFISISTFSQNVIVEYKQKQKIDQKTISKYPTSIQKILKAKLKWTPALLIQKNQKSVYLTDPTIIDSIAKASSITIGDYEHKIIAGNTKYFKNFFKNESLKEVNTYDKSLIIKDITNKLKWQTLQDKKTINGMLCYKATSTDERGNIIEVWYNKGTSVKNGPLNFEGLPGLIVQVNSKKWEIELVSIKHPKELQLISPNKNAEIITHAEYLKNYANKRQKVTRKKEYQ